MDIKQLKYFTAIVEEGNISAAAKKLHIAQPPLSFQLKMLEEELGVRLIERGARRIRLTDAGATLYKRAVSVLSFINATTLEMADIATGTGGALHIGTVSSSGAALVNRRIGEFNRRYPKVRFEVYEGNTFELLELLDAGKIEIAIVRTPFRASGLNYIYLNPEPMVAVIPPSMENLREKCRKNGDKITIDDLKGVELIMYKRFEELILSCCAQRGFEPEFFCKNEDARTTLLWYGVGAGVAIIPQSSLGLAPNKDMYCAEIDEPKLYTQIAAIWKKNRYISQTASNFLEIFSSGDRDAV